MGEEIHVGDILYDSRTKENVVATYVDDHQLFVMFDDGTCGEVNKSSFTNTGRSIDIDGLLNQISAK